MDEFVATAQSFTDKTDTKKLFSFFRAEQELLRANAHLIESAVEKLEVAAHAELLCGLYAVVSHKVLSDDFVAPWLVPATASLFLNAPRARLRKCGAFAVTLCRNAVNIAAAEGGATPSQKRSLLGLLRALHAAAVKFAPSPEVLTPLSSEFLRACVKACAYHVAIPLLERSPIYDLLPGPLPGAELLGGPLLGGPPSPARDPCGVSTKDYLCYWYYGALVWIALKEFHKAQASLLIALTSPSFTVSAIQADAYKKYLLVSRLLTGEVPSLPKYASPPLLRYVKNAGAVYDGKIADYIREKDEAALATFSEELKRDGNFGLAKQVARAFQRQKVSTLTQTYLTLSLDGIRTAAAMEGATIAKEEVEQMLLELNASREIEAKIDQPKGTVSFEESQAGTAQRDADIGSSLEKHLAQVLQLAKRVAQFEKDLVATEGCAVRNDAQGIPNCGGGMPLGQPPAEENAIDGAGMAIDSMDM